MRRNTLKALAFLLPVLLFAVLFVYYPFIKTLINSFCTVNSMGRITGFAGLDNYASVFGRSDFRRALRNTLLLTAINVPITLVITVSLGLLATEKRKLGPVYETMFAMPMSVSMAAACMIFKSMMSPTLGFVNYFLGTNLKWFESRETALYSCIIITVWMGIGFDYLLFQSAFRAIPRDITDAADLDGAGFFAKLFKVRLPLVSPTIFYVFCTNTVLAMMTSAPMIIITQGGPGRSTATLMYMMFASGYGSANYSLAAIVSLTAFVLTLGFTLLAFVYERKKVIYE